MYPRLFEIGPVTLYTYGLLLAAAYLLGLKLAMVRAARRGLDGARILDLGIYIIISALVGAKLMLLVVDFRYFSQNPAELLSLARSGGVFYGGLILAVAVAGQGAVALQVLVADLEVVDRPTVEKSVELGAVKVADHNHSGGSEVVRHAPVRLDGNDLLGLAADHAHLRAERMVEEPAVGVVERVTVQRAWRRLGNDDAIASAAVLNGGRGLEAGLHGTEVDTPLRHEPSDHPAYLTADR